jgi:hypothetical protein
MPLRKTNFGGTDNLGNKESNDYVLKIILAPDSRLILVLKPSKISLCKTDDDLFCWLCCIISLL